MKGEIDGSNSESDQRHFAFKNPVMINGNNITEMNYDSNEINGILFAEAESKRKAAAGRKDMQLAPAAEFDFSLHLYLGFASIVAVNPSYDFLISKE